MKKLFVSASFVLVAGAVILALAGYLSPGVLVAFSIAGLGLIYTLALWTAFSGTQELEGR